MVGVFAQDVRDVVGLPGLSDLGIDDAGIAVEERHGAPVFPSRAPDPLKRSVLPAVLTENPFLLRALFLRHGVLAVFADQRPGLAVGLAVEILRWRGAQIRAGEAAEV